MSTARWNNSSSTCVSSNVLIQEPTDFVTKNRNTVCTVTHVINELLHLSIDVSDKCTSSARLSSRNCRTSNLETSVLELSVYLQTSVSLCPSSWKHGVFGGKVNASVTVNMYWNDCYSSLPIDSGFLKHFNNMHFIIDLLDDRPKVKLLEDGLERSKCRYHLNSLFCVRTKYLFVKIYEGPCWLPSDSLACCHPVALN